MRLQEQRRVKTPQQPAFDYTADFSNIENWDPGVAGSRKIGDDPVGRGTRYDLDVKFGGRTVPMVYEINVFEPHERVVLIGKGETLDAVDEIRFRTEGDETVIDYTADLTFHNWIKYVVPFISPMLRRVGTRAVDGLVTALDG
jgi:carbon monoxide dehydrogenase subunit G